MKAAVLIALPISFLILFILSLARPAYVEPLFLQTTFYFLLVTVAVWAAAYLTAARDVRRADVVAWIKDNPAGIAVAVAVTVIAALAIVLRCACCPTRPAWWGRRESRSQPFSHKRRDAVTRGSVPPDGRSAQTLNNFNSMAPSARNRLQAQMMCSAAAGHPCFPGRRASEAMRAGAMLCVAIVAGCANNAVRAPAASVASPPVHVASAPTTNEEIPEGPPRVMSVDPTHGTTAGGEEVSIVGSGFVPGKMLAEVTFGRRHSPQVTVAATNRIHVVTPPGDEGPVDITVAFDDGSVFSIRGCFRYVGPPDGAPARAGSADPGH